MTARTPRAGRRFWLMSARLLFSALAAVWLSGSAAASAATVTQFTAGIRYPVAITAGPDRNLWFTEPTIAEIGKITLSGHVMNFPVPGVPAAITGGPDGNVWFTGNTNNSLGEPVSDWVGRITPTGHLTEFPVPSYAGGITSGPDGDLWFTQAHAIGRITPSGHVTEFPASGDPGDITAGPGGDLWFTDSNSSNTGGSIGRITPSGEITKFSSGITSPPESIAAGPGGDGWFTELDGAIGRITPKGKVTEFSRTVPGQPQRITAAPDGNLWFTDTSTDGMGNPVSAVGRITPQGRVRLFTRGITQGPIQGRSQGSQPTGITAGPDGNVWFTELGDPAYEIPAAIARITTDALVSVRARAARVSARGSASVELACGKGSSGRCAGTLRVFERTRVRIAHSRRTRIEIVDLAARAPRFSIAAGRHAAVKLALNRTGRKLLAHAKHRRLPVLAQAVTPANTARQAIVLIERPS